MNCDSQWANKDERWKLWLIPRTLRWKVKSHDTESQADIDSRLRSLSEVLIIDSTRTRATAGLPRMPINRGDRVLMENQFSRHSKVWSGIENKLVFPKEIKKKKSESGQTERKTKLWQGWQEERKKWEETKYYNNQVLTSDGALKSGH